MFNFEYNILETMLLVPLSGAIFILFIMLPLGAILG
jgi:hypothetical protein